MANDKGGGPQTHKPEQTDGFSLVELLVSLSILSMLVALSVQGVRLIAQLDRMLERQNDMQNTVAIETLLRNKLESAVPLLTSDQNNSGNLMFEGYEDRISFVSTSSGETTQAGLYLTSISVATNEKTETASLAYNAWKLTSGTKAKAKKRIPHLSVSGPISKLRFSYFGQSAEGMKWQNQWLERKTLPSLIRVEIHHTHDRQAVLHRTIIVRLPN